MEIEYLQVTMVRPDMKNLLSCELPEGFGIRSWRRGDLDAMVAIWQSAERFLHITDETFRKEFGDDLPAMFRRSFFLVGPDGREIGTATAWYDRQYQDKPWGRVHWVALDPEFQGRGLCKVLMSECMRRLRALGHRRAMLQTQTPRLAAIKTYLNFGFQPDMTTPDAERAWPMVFAALGMEAPARS